MSPNEFKWKHFAPTIILWCLRWYCKYGISYRELQEMLAERGVNVGVVSQPFASNISVLAE